MSERQVIDRGWFYVLESNEGRYAPPEKRLVADDGAVLTRRLHGYPARVEVEDRSGCDLPVATLLRAAAAVGHGLERRGHTGVGLRVVLDSKGTTSSLDGETLVLDGSALAEQPSHHPIQEEVHRLLGDWDGPQWEGAQGDLPQAPVRRVLFFESLMNSELPHNDAELSQGVLHMASALGPETEVVLANVKMAIHGTNRPVLGLEHLDAALAGEAIGLVCITLFEGYFEGAIELIGAIREAGCRAHIAVGGVMPTLSPEHVAAHLPEVSFVCRGAGEVFVPRLAAIVGEGSVDEPFTPGQRRALLNLRGCVAMDRAEEGLRVLAADPAHTAVVMEMDRVALNVSYLTRNHIAGGVELVSSRGCIHRCTFCSIMGRESYQARSSGSVLEVLESYRQHYHTLWGEDIPQSAWRVHFADDDFACDPVRAAEVFRAILQTPFRLSSVQVSVADLCVRERGVLHPRVNDELLDAISPSCFADQGRPATDRDYVADFGSRTWSSYLQLGVESYSDRELIRLGKGYRMAHVRAVISELSRRALHMDGYFILTNAQTTATDMIDVLDEVCRLKLRYPRYFHIRFPIVPRLVSYFSSANHRRMVRRGHRSCLSVRWWARVANHAEFDYPFVQQDEPIDPWSRAAADGEWFTDKKRYTESWPGLRERWLARLNGVSDPEERREGERLCRRLDDRGRRLVFEWIAQARRASQGIVDPSWPGPPPLESEVLRSAEALLGPASDWLGAFRRYDSNETPRLVVIPTWQCELRCRYCFIPKQDGREMTIATLERSIELLLSSHRDRVLLQFFGGEALVRRDLVAHGLEYGLKRAKELGKSIGFILSSNGWSIDEEVLEWLSGYPVSLELSLDGDRQTQNSQRRAAQRGEDSYDNGIAHRAEWIRQSGVPHEVIMVVHPERVAQMASNFFHIVDLGFSRVQINFALGFVWTPPQQQTFADQLHQIAGELRARWDRGEEVMLVNLEGAPMPIRLNGEITVDYDGVVYGGNGFLHETEHKAAFKIGHLDDLAHFDRYWMDTLPNTYLLDWSYPENVTENNLEMGRVFASFVKWMTSSEPGPKTVGA